MFLARFFTFASSAYNSDCEAIAYITRCLGDLNGIFGNNLRELHRLLSPGCELITNSNDAIRQIYRLCDEKCKNDSNMHLARTVSELSQVRDNMLNCPLNKEEINNMIITLTTDWYISDLIYTHYNFLYTTEYE